MKQFIILLSIYLLSANTGDAQTRKKNAAAKTQQQTKSTITKKTDSTAQLKNTNSYNAKAPALPSSTFGWRGTPVLGDNKSIADPVLRTLNNRANGATVDIDFREFMQIGRGTYGLKHGHILLRPNGSTTSGGITGSGTVGTGSSLGNVGVHGTAIGVNGKNTYSGPGMWGTMGTGIGTNFRVNDSTNNSIRLKRD